MSYDDAVTALYQAPVEGFVAERKRLAAELKAAGDKDGAAKLGKLGRPTLSAWAINQLWWHARDAFDVLFETAERIRAGELAAQAPHREAIANLRTRASRMLTDAGHNANEATLRRVTTTLSALAASGGFAPDAPGAIAEDREPLGFDVALSLASVPRHEPAKHPPKLAAVPKPKPEQEPEPEPEDEIDEEEEGARREAAQRELDAEHKRKRDHDADETKRAHDAEKKRAHDEAEARRAEEKRDAKRAEEKREKDARAKAATERSKLIANLATAQSELARRHKLVTSLSEQLEIAEQQVAEADDIIAALQAKLEEHA